jgi:ABC-type glycerol-3-phosphate transport system substrate-binding protein
MRRSMFVVVAAALVASAASASSASAMPIDGVAIAKAAASANQLSQKVYWHHRWGWHYRSWGYRRGKCLHSPAHC